MGFNREKSSKDVVSVTPGVDRPLLPRNNVLHLHSTLQHSFYGKFIVHVHQVISLTSVLQSFLHFLKFSTFFDLSVTFARSPAI